MSREPRREDVGADSSGELARLRARVQELEYQKRQLEIKVIGLQGEIDDLKAERACLRAAAERQGPSNANS
jgi:hypothetical protein